MKCNETNTSVAIKLLRGYLVGCTCQLCIIARGFVRLMRHSTEDTCGAPPKIAFVALVVRDLIEIATYNPTKG